MSESSWGERATIVKALRDANDNMDKAAKALGISRRTLQNRMREYQMTRKKAGRPRRKLYSGKARAWGSVAVGAAALAGLGLALTRGAKPA